jgi:hypothetical protein
VAKCRLRRLALLCLLRRHTYHRIYTREQQKQQQLQ